MTRKAAAHRTRVRKYNLNGWGRMWWLTCTCGFFQGCDHKPDALRMRDDHEMKVLT